MIQIPLIAEPSQTVKIVLNGQNIQISVYTKDSGLFVDINSNGTDIVVAVLALNGVPIICREYMGFLGNMIFIDTQGSNDPTYDALGSRYQLIYMDQTEYV
jgi:hypothetical protein